MKLSQFVTILSASMALAMPALQVIPFDEFKPLDPSDKDRLDGLRAEREALYVLEGRSKVPALDLLKAHDNLKARDNCGVTCACGNGGCWCMECYFCGFPCGVRCNMIGPFHPC